MLTYHGIIIPITAAGITFKVFTISMLAGFNSMEDIISAAVALRVNNMLNCGGAITKKLAQAMRSKIIIAGASGEDHTLI